MKNYQKLSYHEYRIMLSDGSSIVTTRQECFSIEPASEDCLFKQRWYYSPDQYMAVRLPRNELGERLGKDNAADLKAQERLIARNRERNTEIDAYITDGGISLDIPDQNNSVEDTAIMKAELNAIHKAISELPDELKDLCKALIHKEKQMANGAVYSDDESVMEIHDRKLDALEDIIESMNGRPLLVAYWFKHDLERIRKRFEIREIKSSRDISEWNSGKIPVALIHPASAGHGLNLQSGGSTLVWFGLTWSLELYQQTNARLWRQGQTADTVVIQHIIAKGTIDEQIMKALKTKDTTQAALIAAVKADLEVHK